MINLKILMADDEPMILRVLRLQLEKLGHEVHTTPNGQAALEHIHRAAPDVLITDIEMPVLSGEELCKTLAREMPERAFPIFVVTSLTGVHHRAWAKNIDNLHFMEKPLSARKLVAALEAMFSEHRENSSSEAESAS